MALSTVLKSSVASSRCMVDDMMIKFRMLENYHSKGKYTTRKLHGLLASPNRRLFLVSVSVIFNVYFCPTPRMQYFTKVEYYKNHYENVGKSRDAFTPDQRKTKPCKEALVKGYIVSVSSHAVFLYISLLTEIH